MATFQTARPLLVKPGREARFLRTSAQGLRQNVGIGRENGTEADRAFQSTRIVQLLEEDGAFPVSVLGDLNDRSRRSRSLAALRSWFRRARCPKTIPSRFTLLDLDRILVRPDGALRGIDRCRARESRVATDHLEIRGIVEFPGARGPLSGPGS